MSKILNKDAFKVIDLEYWENYGVDGLETVIANKETAIDENKDKDQVFWAIVNEDDFTVPLTNDTVIKGTDLKKMGGYKLLCKVFNDKGYDAFDEKVFKDIDQGYGVTKKETQYKAVDNILTEFGLKTPKSKEAKRIYRNIFWVTRRSFKYSEDEEEIEELKKLKDFKEDENNSFEPTKLADYLDEEDTNIDLFGLE